MFLCYIQCVDSESRSSELTYKTFFKDSPGHYFELQCQEMQLHSWVVKLMLD